jgi:hypothetical protein
MFYFVHFYYPRSAFAMLSSCFWQFIGILDPSYIVLRELARTDRLSKAIFVISRPINLTLPIHPAMDQVQATIINLPLTTNPHLSHF